MSACKGRCYREECLKNFAFLLWAATIQLSQGKPGEAVVVGMAGHLPTLHAPRMPPNPKPPGAIAAGGGERRSDPKTYFFGIAITN
jgi:hypothetical protein